MNLAANHADHAGHVAHVGPVDLVVPVDRGDVKAANFAEAFCIGTASVPAAMAFNTIAPVPSVKVAHAV